MSLKGHCTSSTIVSRVVSSLSGIRITATLDGCYRRRRSRGVCPGGWNLIMGSLLDCLAERNFHAQAYVGAGQFLVRGEYCMHTHTDDIKTIESWCQRTKDRNGPLNKKNEYKEFQTAKNVYSTTHSRYKGIGIILQNK